MKINAKHLNYNINILTGTNEIFAVFATGKYSR